ncbi:MAG: hypothetical protein ACO3M9_04430 [Flavobacteriaceae bacterium]
MRNKIRSLIQDLAHQITEQQLTDDAQLHLQIQKIYELSVVVLYQKENTTPAQQGQENLIESTLRELDLKKATQVEANETPIEEIPPLMDSIKNLVDEMPEAKLGEAVFEPVEKLTFVKKDTHTLASNQGENVKENINDRYSKILKIDLNDRLSFVHHLFDQNIKEYERVIQQISSLTSWEEANYLIEHLVKKEYNDWEGKEVVATRFIGVIKTYFST